MNGSDNPDDHESYKIGDYEALQEAALLRLHNKLVDDMLSFDSYIGKLSHKED